MSDVELWLILESKLVLVKRKVRRLIERVDCVKIWVRCFRQFKVERDFLTI